MSEYGLDPIRISETWTDELLYLTLENFVLRKQREVKAYDNSETQSGSGSQPMGYEGEQHKVSNAAVFQKIGTTIKPYPRKKKTKEVL